MNDINVKPFPPLRKDEMTTVTGDEARNINNHCQSMFDEIQALKASHAELVEALKRILLKEYLGNDDDLEKVNKLLINIREVAEQALVNAEKLGGANNG